MSEGPKPYPVVYDADAAQLQYGFQDGYYSLADVSGVGGSDTQVQFNDGGVFAGDPNFTWDKTVTTLTITGSDHGQITILGDGAASGGQLLIASESGSGGITFTPLIGTGAIAAMSVVGSDNLQIFTTVNTGSISLVSNFDNPYNWTFASDGTLQLPNLSDTEEGALTPVEGAIWYNSTQHAWRGYNGTAMGTFTFTPDA